MALKVADVFEDDEGRSMLPQDLDDLVKECSSRPVPPAILRPRFGEWLTREPGTQDVVLRDVALTVSNVTVNPVARFREVGSIEAGKLLVDF